MVAGLKFLSKKGFNPQNMVNQKRVWEAEQQKKDASRRAKERQQQLDRERDDEELARSRGETPKLGFLYSVPPGLEKGDKTEDGAHGKEEKTFEKDDPASNTLPATADRQPGDDDAAAAFRQMLAAATGGQTQDSYSNSNTDADKSFRGAFGTVLQGSNVDALAGKDTDKSKSSALSALEKAVGRKHDAGGGLTLEEQIQRFPALASAPRAKGMVATDVGVTFKPLGTQIRNVKCLACGVWGHSKGERECKVSGWNPFAMNASSADAKPTPHVDIPPQNARKDAAEVQSRPSGYESSASSSEEKYRKRKARKHRRKHRRERESDESDQSEDASRKRRRHRKSSRKRHKHRRRTESDIDSNDSGEEEKYHRKKRRSSERSKEGRQRGRSRSDWSSDEDDPKSSFHRKPTHRR